MGFTKKILHQSIDIETYAVNEYAAIASIGIADFYIGKKLVIVDKYYANIEQTRNKELKRVYDDSTIKWWAGQNKEVQKALLVDQKPLDVVMKEVYEFITKDSLVWCQGTDFDIPIIRTTFKQLGMVEPWKYYNLRDCRTFTTELGFSMNDFRDTATHHNALDDAICQAKVINHVKYLVESSQ